MVGDQMRNEANSWKRWLAALVASIGIVLVSLWGAHELRAPKAKAASAANDKSASVVENEPTVSVQTPAQNELYKVPVLLPGETCARAMELFGKPTEENQFGLTWNKPDLLIAADKGPKCVLNGIGITVEGLRKALTPEGMILGTTTLADAERILGPHLAKNSESVEAPEGNWDAMISFRPATDARYKITYRAFLGRETADRMSRDPVFDDFRMLPVTQYDLDFVAQVGQ